MPAFETDVSLKVFRLRLELPGDDIQKAAMAVLQSQLNHDHKQNDQDNKSDSDLLHSITLRDSDERATANLDTANGQQAMDIMWRLTEQTGTAFVLATHHSRIVAYARRVIKLRDGRIDGNGANA